LLKVVAALGNASELPSLIAKILSSEAQLQQDLDQASAAITNGD